MRRFFERINAKAEDASQAPILIVALGDSVTQGLLAFETLCPRGVYHACFQHELERRYPRTVFSTINAGVGGNTATQGLQRLERDVLHHQPDLLVVAFGLNDCPEGPAGEGEYRQSLERIILNTQEKTEADIVLLTPPWMAHRMNEARVHPEHLKYADRIISAQCAGYLDAYAEIVRELARKHGLVLADVHAAWGKLAAQGRDTDSLLSNGLNHPDEEGHKIMCDALLKAVCATSSALP